MRLQRAVLCANCDEIFSIEAKQCPRCASKHWSLLEKLMAARKPLAPLGSGEAMSPARFFHRYVDMVPAGSWTLFAEDLIDVAQHERRSERRRMVTDATYYRSAYDEVMADLVQQGARTHERAQGRSGESSQNGHRGADEPGADRRPAAPHPQGDGGVLPGGAGADPGSETLPESRTVKVRG